MTTETAQVPKEELPGDMFANKYIKTPNSTYCYLDQVNNFDIHNNVYKKADNGTMQVVPDGTEFEVGGFHWTKKGSILFKKTKEEHEAWKAKGFGGKGKTWDTRKVTELIIIPLDIAGGHLMSINAKLREGYELFGKDFRSSVIDVPDPLQSSDKARTLIVGMVKKQ
jgi:hypothetical protein